MKTDYRYIDRLYEFEGQWGTPSVCGIKVVEEENRLIVIATELYDKNPGTSVTQFVAQLATRLLKEYERPHEHMLFVEHCPDRGSKLDFYEETFDRVTFEWNGEAFVNPDWERVDRALIDQWLPKTEEA